MEMVMPPQTRKLIAALTAVGLLAAPAAIAQTAMERLPPGSTTFPIHFPTGSDKLDPGDQDTIRSVVAKMNADPTLYATIVGKADKVGSPELNERLAQRRAMAVMEALVYANKAPEDRVAI